MPAWSQVCRIRRERNLPAWTQVCEFVGNEIRPQLAGQYRDCGTSMRSNGVNITIAARSRSTKDLPEVYVERRCGCTEFVGNKIRPQWRQYHERCAFGCMDASKCYDRFAFATHRSIQILWDVNVPTWTQVCRIRGERNLPGWTQVCRIRRERNSAATTLDHYQTAIG